MIIDKNRRLKWDTFVFTTILVSAFEIPYSLIVGWESRSIALVFDLYLYSVFIIDMILNFVTTRTKSYAGIWDWRHFLGAVSFNFSEERFISRNSLQKNELTSRKEIAIDYFFSKWFIIDTLSIIPFELIFGAFGQLQLSRLFRLARIPRTLKLLKTIKIVKAANHLNSIKKVNSSHPSLGRFALLLFFVVWAGHLGACLLVDASNQPPTSSLYLEKLYQVFIVYMEGGMPEVSSNYERTIGVFLMFVGLLAFATLIGNISSFLGEIDEENKHLENLKNDWKVFFKKHPSIFSKELQIKVLSSARDIALLEIEHKKISELINSIPPELQNEVLSHLEVKQATKNLKS